MWPTLFELPVINLPIRGYGLMLMIGFLGATWWATQRAIRVKIDPDILINLGFISLIFGILGGRIFYVIHYWDERFAGKGFWAPFDITAGGLEVYGGLIGAVLADWIYLQVRGAPVRLIGDIAAPSVMFGLSMGRIGCFLNGCCWGGLCAASLPWGVQFPYASPAFYDQWEGRQITVPAEVISVTSSGLPFLISADALKGVPDAAEAERRFQAADARLNQALSAPVPVADVRAMRNERDQALQQLQLAREAQRVAQAEAAYATLHVHPAQLYAAIGALLLALLLNAIFYRNRRFGFVWVMLMLLYPAMRFVEESVRIDNPHDAAGLTISQFVSVVLFAGGVLWLYLLYYRLPARYPIAHKFTLQGAIEARREAQGKTAAKRA